MSEFEFNQERLDFLLSEVTTEEQLNDIEALWQSASKARVLAATKDLRNNSIRMIELVNNMLGHLERLALSAVFLDNSTVTAMRAQLGAIHAQLHDGEGLKKTFSISDNVLEVVNDEKILPGSVSVEQLPSGAPIIETPRPINASSYVSLADEYIRFFIGAQFRSSHETKIRKFVDIALANRDRYELVGEPLGIPWWFVAGIHQMESTYNFATHLHNGDSLSRRTVHVPAGLPATGIPPFTWEESAIDALKRQKLDSLSDWSLPRALWRWERYNGFGYRKRLIPTPYLWSFSTVYARGKYVQDGVWDGAATSAQCGAAVLLKALVERGSVSVHSDLKSETEPSQPDVDVDAQPASIPNSDNDAPATHPFQAFWNEHLADVQHFSWREFLYKGAKHEQNGLNTDPPSETWPNVIPLARALDTLRTKIGKPISLLSVFRSPEYNASIGGSAARSQHMAFRAADFKVVGANAGTPGNWADAASTLRSQGVFEGGIGIYPSFVHIDTRGIRANWDER